jgi:DNA-binding MarR family transcriptional regulator
MTSKALDFCLKLGRAQAALVRRFDSSLGGWHGVGLGDFMIMYHLSEAPGGRLRRVDLAERLGLTVSGATRALLPMEKIGLVSRESDSRDARVAYAVLTPAGHELFANALASAEQISQNIIPPDLANNLQEMSDILVRIGGIRPSGG